MSNHGALFIAGSWAGNDACHAAVPGKAVGRQWCPQAGTKGNLCGVKADINNCRERLVPHLYENRLAWSKYLDKPGAQLRKSEVVENLIELFQQPNKVTCHVYYTGHGCSYTGDWCFENAQGVIDEFITFDELMNLWEAHNSGDTYLALVMDSCFSGAWVNKAKNHKFAKKIIVSASCRENELSYESALGGYFMADYIDATVKTTCNDGLRHIRELYRKGYDGKQHPQCWLGFTGSRFGL